MADQQNIVCALALERHRNAARWLQLYNLLIFVLSAAVVVFAVVTLLLFAREDTIGGIAGAAGTVVGGTGIAWVLKRRGDAKKEEIDFYDEAVGRCTQGQPAGDTPQDVRAKTTFFGFR